MTGPLAGPGSTRPASMANRRSRICSYRSPPDAACPEAELVSRIWLMSVSAEVLREHLRYTSWASQHLVRALEQLPADHLSHDFQTADRSILGSLVHIFAADRIWLSRVKGDSPTAFLSEADHHLSVLKTDWPLIYEKW